MPPHWWPPTCQEHLSPLPPLTHQQFSLLVSSGPRTAADFNGVLHFSSAIWKYLESLVDFRWRMILIAVPNAGQWYCHAPARRMKCHLGILACYNLEPEHGPIPRNGFVLVQPTFGSLWLAVLLALTGSVALLRHW